MWTEGGTYVETDQTFTHPTTYEWNHGLGEIVTALSAHGLDLTMLLEHDSAPWDALPGQTVETDGEWRLADRPSRLPQTFTMQARKRCLAAAGRAEVPAGSTDRDLVVREQAPVIRRWPRRGAARRRRNRPRAAARHR